MSRFFRTPTRLSRPLSRSPAVRRSPEWPRAEAAEDAVAASATLAARHFTYEQATGRMFLTEAGENDLMATGYSG